MYALKPGGAPSCWSLKYQDGDRECDQCRYNDSCRAALLERTVAAPPRSLPVVPARSYTPPYPPPPAPVFNVQPQQQMVPLPARPYVPPPPQQMVKQPQTVAQVTQQANQYYQQSTGYSLPSQQSPNPFTPMHRPGAPAPAYYFTQYPGESVGTRIAKNAILRALEAIMLEFMQFFRHWTWPPAGGR